MLVKTLAVAWIAFVQGQSCPEQPGYTLKPNQNWQAAPSVKEGSQKATGQAAKAACDADDTCIYWNNYGYTLLGAASSFFPYDGLCIYEKQPKGNKAQSAKAAKGNKAQSAKAAKGNKAQSAAAPKPDIPFCTPRCSPLGDAIDVRSRNMLSLSGDRAPVFNSSFIFGSVCMTRSVTLKSNRDETYFESTSAIESYIARSCGLDVSGSSASAAVSASFAATTTFNHDESSKISSAKIDISQTVGELTLDKTSECRGPSSFNPQFVAAVKSLNALIQNPALNDEWAIYDSFFKTWGTHVVTSVSLGSRYTHWESAKDLSQSSASDLKIKACVSVEGSSGEKGWSANACAGYTSEQRQRAASLESHQVTYILGGSGATQAALQNKVTPQTMNAFINSMRDSKEPIQNQFTSMWDLLRFAYDCGNDECRMMKQIAMNMEAAFEGFYGFGCPEIRARDAPIQQFQAYPPSADGLVRYKCWVRKTGCMSNDDCHLDAGSRCHCYGAGCIDRTDGRNFVRSSQTGSSNVGVNNACYYKVFAHCNCEWGYQAQGGERNLWDQAMPR